MYRIGMLVAVGIACLAVILTFKPTDTADAVMQLKWVDLVPKKVAPAQPDRTFFSGSTPMTEGEPPPPPLREGGFMSMKRRQPGGDRPPAIVTDLNGKRVQIGGYIVPLDFEATTIKEFLLVPFVGACIHVPPPPANQIVFVKAESGFEFKGMFEPVKVTGILKAETAFTGLADAGYSLDADNVEVVPE